MGTQRYRTLPLVLLSATLGFTTGMLGVAGLAAVLIGRDPTHLSPWLDPRSVANWVVLFCLAAAGVALAVLAERADRRAPAPPPAEVPIRSMVNVMPEIGDRHHHVHARAA